jgi:CobQ-like glutamine amidotransferase family enzyme
MTFEQIQDAYPELLIGLQNHPGIGFVLVRSEEQGDIVIGKGGVHYLADDHVDGIDPIAVYGPNAPRHLRRESSYSNCPDLVVNTLYDPETQELAGFENQAATTGLGGPQNHAFILSPVELPYNGSPIIANPSTTCRSCETVQELNGLN